MDLFASLWGFLPSVLRTLIAFAVVLGVLVFVHEYGHYLAARWRGVHVDAFAIGFGKPIARWTDGRGTEWRIGWIPLGGYVKLHGQETPEHASAETQASWRRGETFHEKPVSSRAIVVAAGPVANFLLAALLFAGIYATVGKPSATTAIGAVQADSAAARAGLEAGDQIISLDGRSVARFEQVQRHIQERPGQAVQIVVRRDDREREFTAIPDQRAGASGPVGVLGIQGGAAQFETLGIGAALVAGVQNTVDVSWQTLVGIGEMFSGDRSAAELGGPIRIAEISGQAADLGLLPLVNLMALLSVSLGLLNLFPVPMLDGGHLMFYAAEAIRGRPLPARAMEYGFRAGFAVLVTLFLFASWNDFAHGSLGRWVVGLVG